MTDNLQFISPYDVKTPAGADGWEKIYPYHLLFSRDDRGWSNEAFWFKESLHWPDVIFPFDTIILDAVKIGISQYNSRIFSFPAAYGIETRIINGRVYFSPVPVNDPELIRSREKLFLDRVSYYFANWEEIYTKWIHKMEGLIQTLEKLPVPQLLRSDYEEIVFQQLGVSSGFRLVESFDLMIHNLFLAWQYHFEMLNIGYFAYYNFFNFCKYAFPGITDASIGQMLAGNNLVMFQPDGILRKLAKSAVELGLNDIFLDNEKPDDAMRILNGFANGKKWIAEFEESRYPWFYFSNNMGFHHRHRAWIDDLTLPWMRIVEYVEQLSKKSYYEEDRIDIVNKRNSIRNEYRSLLSDEDDQNMFDRCYELANKVIGYVEDHNFWVENWHHTVFWNKVRSFGQLLVSAQIYNEPDDIFLWTTGEVKQILFDLVGAWSTGAPLSNRNKWKIESDSRKRIVQALELADSPNALGIVPSEIKDPFIIMLWGITDTQVRSWLEHKENDNARVIYGVAASTGKVTGRAKIILSSNDLSKIQEGDIIVCVSLASSWGSVLHKAIAVVNDNGGVMSHAAIICREFNLPTVVGTIFATKRIKDGDTIVVDGFGGKVTILS